MVLEKQRYTLDDLLAMGEDARVEIIEGELVAMTAAGGVHQIIAGNIIRILDAYVVRHDLGVVFPDGMTYLMNSPAKGLKDSFVPDVSYIKHENVPENWNVSKPHPGAPDLAVEIVSPGDDVTKLHQKLRTYLDMGTIQVWVVHPTLKEIHQYTKHEPDTARIYKGSATVDAEALFPAIEGLTTAAIFRMPKWALKDE
jgi:Uma2 family endonuclease